MYKWVGTEIVADGKMAEYKAWWEARDKLFRKHGMQPFKAYQVEGRSLGMVFFEGPEFETQQEWEKWLAQYAPATESLHREDGIVVPGSCEFFILTDF